jgi:hypothetical protein
MVRRRALLRGGATAAAVALAGCPATTDESSAAAQWQYDPEARYGIGTVAAGSADLQAVLEAPLEEDFADELSRLDDDTESIEFESVETVSLTGFTDLEREAYGVSVVAIGEFDASAVRDELTEEGYEPADAEYDVDRYEDSRTAVAVREHALVYGQLVDTASGMDNRSYGEFEMDPARAALAAESGDAERFGDREDAATVRSELDSDVRAAFELGAEFRRGLSENLGGDREPMARIIESVQAFGFDATFEGETTALSYAAVADPEELDLETVRSFLDEVEATEDSSIEDVSVSRDGRAVVVSAEADTGTLVESHAEALFGTTERRQPTPPQPSVGIERTADERVGVTHEGGETVERPLAIRFDAVEPDGTEGTADEIWSDTPIRAGDEYVSRNEAQAEATVRVIWSSEDGSVATTLAKATV